MASPSTDAAGVENRRIRLDPDDRREQILEAAQRLFAERPYSGVSTTDLARAAGTTRTNLNYYFGTKRGLYLDVLRRFGHLPELPPQRRATGPDELRRVLGRWLDVLEQNPQTIMTMIGTVAPGSDPEVEAVFRSGMRAWEDRIVAVLDLADDPVTRAKIRSYQGLVSAAVAEWLTVGSLTKPQVHDLLVRTVLTIADQPPAS
ncbi:MULTISPECIES: TetR/AcrR family transcriptional regulator [unclassified Pseudonocardia]|uniref:TetR/AcrR family transcriptional regulator n=1 Tax=unclassified Pseudonocardia TaxID=2619320 RepID=UPI0011154489|nr:TetR/AcrR family transcriptional regulator [Pseudonocardia sp. Ae707_Ps1]